LKHENSTTEEAKDDYDEVVEVLDVLQEEDILFDFEGFEVEVKHNDGCGDGDAEDRPGRIAGRQ